LVRRTLIAALFGVNAGRDASLDARFRRGHGVLVAAHLFFIRPFAI
jgi:hypothetical protein